MYQYRKITKMHHEVKKKQIINSMNGMIPLMKEKRCVHACVYMHLYNTENF